jgi:hypothetical protein
VHVVLLPGTVRSADRVGHHDYLAGCSLLASLLEQTAGVTATVVPESWPADERVLTTAQSLVFYTGGGHKQVGLQSPQRIDHIQQLVDRGVGLVLIHQAIRYPLGLENLAKAWVGGAYVPGESAGGHWRSHHRAFPSHPVTNGVTPWRARDGWHNRIRFADEMRGVTPLVWSSAKYRGSNAGGVADVVAWAYDRPAGGRSFCFTGADAHSAWAASGLRQLVVNAILWSAGLPIPHGGASCSADDAVIARYLTPRDSPPRGVGRALRKLLRRWRKEI